MMKRIFATSALAALLASGAFAQTAPATEPVTDPPAPAEGAEDVTAPPGEGVEMIPDGEAEPEAELAMPGTEIEDPMEGWTPVEFGTLSSEQLIGTNIVTYDNETIASIEDVLITGDGQVESIVARFGGFLGFGSDAVLLTIDEVEVMQDENETLMVRTNLTPESIESRPVFEETDAPG